MTETVISVEKLSKRYIIGHQRDGQDALRHALEDAFRHPLCWLRKRKAERESTREEFWALQDVSFEVKQGEAVGIIGRNGAGKSTLLKVLSRITDPTTGRIHLKGRVASLLEVGTGFHQELTGRENIYLNGAILGMTRHEIRRKFDDIVAFSEVERFLDTPVKRYSSGMYVRLAFAVAAYLEPEILIVDEVLAVGDVAFQKKCLGKMGEVAHGGRTVLFVSHNMSAVQALCDKAVYLQEGTVKAIGNVEPVLNQYLIETGGAHGQRFAEPISMGPALKLLAFDFTPNTIRSGDALRFTLKLCAEGPTTIHEMSVLIYSAQNIRVALLDLRSLQMPMSLLAGEEWRAEGEIRSVPLVEGNYSIGLYVNASNYLENVFDLTSFSVGAHTGNGSCAPVPAVYRGLVELDCKAAVVGPTQSNWGAELVAGSTEHSQIQS